jgi:hypothetical protein
MMRLLVYCLSLAASAGCASSFMMQPERGSQVAPPPANQLSIVSADGMMPLIRAPRRGTGVVIGVRVPFDLSRTATAPRAAL